MRSPARLWGTAAALSVLAVALHLVPTEPHARARVDGGGPGSGDGLEDRPEPAVAEASAEGDGSRAEVNPERAGGRPLEVAFDGITETWRGREVGLHLFRADANQWHDVRLEVGPSVLCNVPVGHWDLDLRDDRGRLLWPTRGAITRSDATIHLRLPAGCRVEGTIATADRSPFVGDLYIGDVWHLASTDAHGSFDAGFLPEGPREVAVLCKGAGFVAVGRIDVGGEGTMRVHVAIRGNGSFRGSVRWEPMEGLDLSFGVFRAGGKERVASIHSEGGPFEMNHLEAGSYELRSEALAAPVTFAVWDGRCTDLDAIEPLPPLEWRWRSDREDAGSGD